MSASWKMPVHCTCRDPGSVGDCLVRYRRRWFLAQHGHRTVENGLTGGFSLPVVRRPRFRARHDSILSSRQYSVKGAGKGQKNSAAKHHSRLSASMCFGSGKQVQNCNTTDNQTNSNKRPAIEPLPVEYPRDGCDEHDSNPGPYRISDPYRDGFEGERKKVSVCKNT